MTVSDVERDEHEITPLELFLDLTFVFAMTQVTILLADDPTWGGVFRGMLVLAALWWAWSAYAWLTSAMDVDEGGVRLVMLASMGAMFGLSIVGDLSAVTAAVFALGGLTHDAARNELIRAGAARLARAHDEAPRDAQALGRARLGRRAKRAARHDGRPLGLAPRVPAHRVRPLRRPPPLCAWLL